MAKREDNEQIFSNYASTVEGTATQPQVQGPGMAGIEPIIETPEPDFRDRMAMRMGFHSIDVKTLPSGGLFYPEGTEILIRSARGEEIKHWSTMDDTEIQSIKGCWDYIIEKCVTVKMPDGGTWRDLVEIDELYLLLAVRELTFIDNDNNLCVPISENKQLPVTKEMIDYIKFPDELMKYYSSEKRCFVLKLKSGKEICIYLPTFGVNHWLTAYAEQKLAIKESVDMDILQYAPLLIHSTKGLTKKTYEEFCYQVNNYDVQEWGVISWAQKALKEAIVPQFKYKTEDGQEAVAQISFLGGPKAIFSISDPLSVLC